MLDLTIWWCGEGEEKQTLCNSNGYKFNKYFLLWYLTSMPNTELCIPAEISCIVWFNKNRGQVNSKSRKLYDFHGGKSISKANWYSSFSSFCILIFTRFFYCTVPAASLFNVLQHLLTTLAISSWKLPAWVSSWPRCLGWVPKGDFNLHASWLLNFTNTFFVDLKTFFLHILSSAGRWFDTQTHVGPRSTNV